MSVPVSVPRELEVLRQNLQVKIILNTLNYAEELEILTKLHLYVTSGRSITMEWEKGTWCILRDFVNLNGPFDYYICFHDEFENHANPANNLFGLICTKRRPQPQNSMAELIKLQQELELNIKRMNSVVNDFSGDIQKLLL